jgi:hypothetical protein
MGGNAVGAETHAPKARGTRQKSRGQSAELRWSFVLDGGRWRWLACLEQEPIAASTCQFDTLAECMTDAAVHGYEP